LLVLKTNQKQWLLTKIKEPQVTLEIKEPKRTNGRCFFKLFISPATLVETNVGQFFTFMKTIKFQFLKNIYKNDYLCFGSEHKWNWESNFWSSSKKFSSISSSENQTLFLSSSY